MQAFHSKNEAKEFLLGEFENAEIVEDYRNYVDAMFYIRELTDSEYYFMVSYDEVMNGVKHDE